MPSFRECDGKFQKGLHYFFMCWAFNLKYTKESREILPIKSTQKLQNNIFQIEMGCKFLERMRRNGKHKNITGKCKWLKKREKWKASIPCIPGEVTLWLQEHKMSLFHYLRQENRCRPQCNKLNREYMT